MKKRSRHSKTEYEKARSGYRKAASSHVIVLEADMAQDEERDIIHDADVLRRAGNELTAVMRKRYEQFIRTKRYRALQKLYGRYSGKKVRTRGKISLRRWRRCRPRTMSHGKTAGRR